MQETDLREPLVKNFLSFPLELKACVIVLHNITVKIKLHNEVYETHSVGHVRSASIALTGMSRSLEAIVCPYN